MWRWAMASLIAVTTACTAGSSPLCRDVCARQAECQERLPGKESTFDENECVSACAALERDERGRAQVKKVADCVAAARTCEAVRACR